MSELINNNRERIDRLKSLLLKLHQGADLNEVKSELTELLGSVPYGEVVQAEQELISEGLPPEEIQKYCDLHSGALKENIDLSYVKDVSEGHPVHTLREENKSLAAEVEKLKEIFIRVNFSKDNVNPEEEFLNIRSIFNNLLDIEKHYVKKENLLFSYLEKYGITGPSSVMWGKDDEVRGFIKSAKEVFKSGEKVTTESLQGLIEFVFKPASDAILEMIDKEEKILFPMCLEKFTELTWFEIYEQFDEIGYCIYSPSVEWKTDLPMKPTKKSFHKGRIRLTTGTFNTEELEAILNSLPVDLTFVDRDDKVKFFSHGSKRIFERNKAILGREVQYCHPPSSVHIVDKIINDFRSGVQDSAKFWINYQDMLVHIAYYPVRNDKGEYLGTLEVTHDVKEYKDIEGERRLLTYDN
jgi:DUF438 domain-containing protein